MCPITKSRERHLWRFNVEVDEDGLWGHRSVGKVQAASLWPFDKTPPLLLYDTFLTECQDAIISAVSFFFSFCSSFCLLFQWEVFSDVFEILRLPLPHISWHDVDSYIRSVVVVADFFLLKWVLIFYLPQSSSFPSSSHGFCFSHTQWTTWYSCIHYVISHLHSFACSASLLRVHFP